MELLAQKEEFFSTEIYKVRFAFKTSGGGSNFRNIKLYKEDSFSPPPPPPPPMTNLFMAGSPLSSTCFIGF